MTSSVGASSEVTEADLDDVVFTDRMLRSAKGRRVVKGPQGRQVSNLFYLAYGINCFVPHFCHYWLELFNGMNPLKQSFSLHPQEEGTEPGEVAAGQDRPQGLLLSGTSAN